MVSNLSGLPDGLDLARHEQVAYALALLADGDEVLAAHQEIADGRVRVTALTRKLLLVIQAEAKSWSSGHLVDEDIEISAWRQADIASVAPRSLRLHQPFGTLRLDADFESLEVRLTDGTHLTIPSLGNPDEVSASAELRSAIWRSWLNTL